MFQAKLTVRIPSACLLILAFLFTAACEATDKQAPPNQEAAQSPSQPQLYKGEMIQTDHTYLLKIVMTDNLNGWAESDGMIVRTIDGAKTWLKATPKELQLHGITSGLMIHSFFFNGNHAWIARPPMIATPETEGAVWRTDDGGEHWSRTLLPTSERWEQGAEYFLDFPDLTHGYILVTLNNLDYLERKLYATSDGGVSWKLVSDITKQFKPNNNITRNIRFTNVNEGWIATDGKEGMDSLTNTSLYRTEDGGRTWTPVSIRIQEKYSDMERAEVETPQFWGQNGDKGILKVGLILQQSSPVVIYSTEDGGKSWRPLAETPVISTNLITFVDEEHGYALDNKMNHNKLYATSNGGKSWSLKSDISVSRINVWHFRTLLEGWVSSSEPENLYATEDGGMSWTPILFAE